MGIVNKTNTFSNGTTADATEVNTNFDTLYNLVNGNIDENNIDYSLSTVKNAILTALKDVDGADSGLVADTISNNGLKQVYPVGSIYINATDATDPSSLLGFGTWEKFSEGRVLVGHDSTDADFDTAEKTGGEKEHSLTDAEMPSHNHSVSIESASTQYLQYNQSSSDAASGSSSYKLNDHSGYANENHNHTINQNAVGSDEGHNNLQPYITCYMWKRTA